MTRQRDQSERVSTSVSLTRGIVRTATGAFGVSRGRVETPDALGESLGWRLVDRDDERADDAAVAPPRLA